MKQDRTDQVKATRPSATFRQRAADVVLLILARLTLRVFFRRIAIEGTQRIPREVPLILVANHFNGLVDPLLLSFLPVRPRFLAKSTLWENPLVRPLLGLSAAVPVYRQQDEGVDL